MLRFVHTADWQIGMRAAHVGSRGEAVRRERLLAAGRVVQVAREAEAQFLLVAGDTFEDHAVDRSLVRQIADTLAEFPGPVYILPGNHDPLTPGSVWDHPAWRDRGNLVVLCESKPLRIEGGWLFPCPAVARHSRQDPTAWIATATQESGFRIGVAHGTLASLKQDEPDYPIALEAARHAALDYLALGHWHSTTVVGERIAYSGTHETTKFGERDSGQALVVEIAAPGAAPRILPRRTGGLAWHQVHRELRQPGRLAAVRRELEQIASRDTSLLELKLTGCLFEGDFREQAAIERLIREEFLFARNLSQDLYEAPEGAWWTELPAGPLRTTAERLADWSRGDFDGPRPEGADPQTAWQALRELHHLSRAEVAPS